MGSVQVFLPVDASIVERERSALLREIETCTRDIETIERKLASEGFVKKAPPDVVAGERRRLEESNVALRLARERLETLP